MPSAQIANANGSTPATVGQVTYRLTNSDRAQVDLLLTLDIATPRQFSVQFPASAPAQVTLMLAGFTLDLLPGPINDTTTFAGRRVVAATATAGSDTILTCEISVLSSAATEPWTVRISGLASGQCLFTQADNAPPPATATITRVLVDPVAAFTIAPPGGTAQEKTSVTMTASMGLGSDTMLGGPSPTVYYRWTHTGNLAIPAFPMCGIGTVENFIAPGVYGSQSISLELQVWFEGSCPNNVGFLHKAAPPVALTIEPRTQHLMLVLDRSGSMSGSKWDNTRTSARILAHLFGALREAVDPDDRLGILVFEDNACSFHPAPLDPSIAAMLPLADVATAANAVCETDLGTPGSCTPIGDGLIAAMDQLGALPTTGNPRYTLILLTDGYENAGTVKVSPDTPGTAALFSVARVATPQRQQVSANLSIFTIALGSEVQEDVLSYLPLPAGAGTQGGIYQKITDVAQLKHAMAEMVSFSQEAQSVPPLAAAPSATTRTFQLEAQVQRLAVAVQWPNANGDLALSRRNLGDAGPFQPVNVPVRKCPTHGFLSVDVAALFGGVENVPGTEWQIVHTVGQVAQPLADDQLLVVVDLFAKAEIVFDRDSYQTGDSMHITARLRAGDQPVRKARVRVELARPGESLGTFLGKFGDRYQPRDPQGEGDKGNVHPKLAMLRQLLREQNLRDLPTLRPTGMFDDGSDELHDDGQHEDGDANDGDFANRYSKLDMEGTYTWQFTIEGRLPDGSPLRRVMTISKWVGVNVEPKKTPLTAKFDLPGPHGLLAADVTMRPQDRYGQLLGPFRAGDVAFFATTGRFDGDVVSHYDGTYSQRLLYSREVRPGILATAQGKAFPMLWPKDRDDGRPSLQAVPLVLGATIETEHPALLVAGGSLGPGRHQLSVQVLDAAGNPSKPVDFDLEVRDTRPPTAAVRGPRIVEHGEDFIIDAGLSADVSPGQVVAYLWTLRT
jgi:hypothetical protein